MRARWPAALLGALDLSLDGAAVAHTVEKVSETAAFTTHRVTVAASSPGQLTLTIPRPEGRGVPITLQADGSDVALTDQPIPLLNPD